MKKIFKLFILTVLILSMANLNVFAMRPAWENPSNVKTIAKVTDRKSYTGYGFGFVAAKYDDGKTNGVAVTGIGGKDSTDESIQLFSRVITGDGDFRANFRLEVTFKNLLNKGVFKWEKGSDGKYWYGEDIVYEFKVMPNKHVTGITFTGPGAPDRLTGLSTTEWTDVKIVIDADKKVCYTYLNGELHKTKTNLATSTLETPYMRIGGATTIPDELYAEQSEVQNDSDVWFYFDDLHIYHTEVACPNIYVNETDSYDMTKGGRINSDDGSNSVVGGVLGKPSSDKVFKLVTNTTATSERTWYGMSSGDAPFIPEEDLNSTTMDTVYETSFVITENVKNVIFENNIKVVSFTPDKLRVNQWNKVKAVYSPSTQKWTVYLNGKYYNTYTAGSEGKYRFAFNTPTGISDTLYMDNIRVYQTPTGIENFEEATVELPETYELTENKRVVDIKKDLGLANEKNVAVYEDDTYTKKLNDGDRVSDGNIVVTYNTHDVFQYCKIESKIHGNIVYGGSAKHSETTFSEGTLNVDAYSAVPAKLYIAQYDTNGKVIDLAVSETKTGIISLDYETKDVGGKLKIFLWDAEGKPISENITMNYQKSMDVLIIGNSYSRDTLFYLRDIAEEFGIDIRMGLAYQSGKNLTYHYENRENNVISFYVNDFAANPVGSNVSLNSIITNPDYDWDVIILQNYYGGSNITSKQEQMWVDGLELAKYIHNLVPDAIFRLNQVWSIDIGYSTMDSEATQDAVDEYMYNRNKQFADEIEEALDLDYEVEVGYVGKAIATARDYIDEDGLRVFGATYSKDAFTAVGDEYNDNRKVKYEFGYGIMPEEEKNTGIIKLIRDAGHLTPIARYMAGAIWFEIITGQSIYSSTFTPPADTNIMCGVPTSDGDYYYLTGSFVAPDIKYVNIMKNIAHQTNINK